MKKHLILTACMALILGSANASPAQMNVDVVGGMSYYGPDNDEDWDLGFHFDMAVRFWLNDYVGVSLAASPGAWAANEDKVLLADPEGTFRGEIEGTASVLPVGFSLLARPLVTERLNLTVEAGIRYVLVESDVEVEIDLRYADGSREYYKDTIEIDDGVVAIAGANLEVTLTDTVGGFFGGGYQFDVEKGDTEWMSDDVGENELEAFFVRLGGILRF